MHGDQHFAGSHRRYGQLMNRQDRRAAVAIDRDGAHGFGDFHVGGVCNKSARADRCILFRSMRQAAAILLFLAAVPPLGAREIVFDTWTVRDGLPQGSIYDIIQTRDGYIWLATL